MLKTDFHFIFVLHAHCLPLQSILTKLLVSDQYVFIDKQYV